MLHQVRLRKTNDPKDLGTYARWLRSNGSTKFAQEAYAKAVSLAPSNGVLLNNYASFLQKSRGDYAKAEIYYRRALTCTDALDLRQGMLLNLAQVMTLQQRTPEEVDGVFVSALELSPTSPDCLVAYAMFRQTVNDFAGAEQLLRQATAIEQGHVGGLNGLAVLLESVKGAHDDAEECYRRAYEADANHVPTLANLAHNLHAFKRDYDAAETLYKRALSLSPDHCATLCNYGYLLQNERGNIAAAEALFKQAIALNPAHEAALINYAGLVAKWGQEYSLAETLYKQALRVNPTHLMALTNYASMLHHGMDRLEEAEKVYKQTLDIQPSYVPAMVNYGLLLEQRKELEGAASLYHRALQLDPLASVPASAQGSTCLMVRGA